MAVDRRRSPTRSSGRLRLRRHRHGTGHARHRARHAHRGDGATDALNSSPCSRWFKAGAVPVLVDPGIDKRALSNAWTKRKRTPSSASRWRAGEGAARLGEIGANQHHHRIARVARRRDAYRHRTRWHRMPPATRQHAAGRRRRDPVHQRQHRRAPVGRGVFVRLAFVTRCCATYSASKPVVSTCRRSRRSRCSILRSSAWTSDHPDMDPTVRRAPRRPAPTATIERFGVDQLFGSPADARPHDAAPHCR